MGKNLSKYKIGRKPTGTSYTFAFAQYYKKIKYAHGKETPLFEVDPANDYVID